MAGLGGVAGLAGCAQYEAKPVTREGIEASLATMPPDELVKAAESLKHPLLPPVRISPDGTVTPQGAAVVAVLQNPSLKAQRLRRGVSEAQLLQAGILPNPQLTASMDFPVAGATEGATDAFGIGVAWDFTSLIARQALIDAARHDKEAVILDIAWQEWQVALGAKLRATRVLWLAKQQRELNQQTADAVALADATQENAALGLVTAVERDAAATLVQRRRIAALANEATLRTENALLRQAMGIPANAAVRVMDSPSAIAAPPPNEQLEKEIEQSRLDLAALRAGYSAQEEKLRVAILNQFPRIGLGIMRSRDNSDIGSLGFGISLDLPIFDRQQGRIATEKATREQLFSELAARTFDARADASKAWGDLESLSPQITESDRTVARLSDFLTSLEASRQDRLADVVIVNQARNDLADAKVEGLRLRQQQAELIIAVEAATGRLFGESKQ